MKFGIQLYSLREYGAKHGLEAILRLASEAGYDGVEFAGYYGHTPECIAQWLDKYGLTAISSHVGLEALRDNFPAEVAYLKAFGIRTAVIPYTGMDSLQEFDALAADMRAIKDTLSGEGVSLGYHNHNQELNQGTDYLEKLTQAVPGLRLELDVFWARAAGCDPVELMRRYGEKLCFLHIKELNSLGVEADNPIVGEGVTGTAEVEAQAVRQNIPWLILEVERTSLPEAEYLARSLAAMKQMVERAS